MHSKLRVFCFIPLLLLLVVGAASAQEELYNNPELNWLSFETEHFVVYYTPGLEDVANMAAEVGEEIHGPLCKLYDYEPDTKVSFIFTDTDDIANAGSYFQSNKIRFYATSMNWDFRGTHNWLRNVVTHEYTHMIQLGATRKWSRSLPAGYFQLLGYEPERRPDVLYGYPNRLISWPWPSVTVPAWFAEGTAQYQFTGTGYDFWDSHRDMLLRQAVLSGRLLSFEDMGYFGKTSLESEGVYNQGYALTTYIAAHAGGAEVLSTVSHKLSAALPVTLNDAFKSETGRSGLDWYNAWKDSLERAHQSLQRELEPTLTRADTIPTLGYVNLNPRLSPAGKRIAFISNQNRDYFGQSSLYLYEIDSAKAKLVAPGAHGSISWTPDGSAIIFSRLADDWRSGYKQYDLFAYMIGSKKSIRLTDGLRAECGDVSPDGKHLVVTINESGRREIGLLPFPDIRDGKAKPVTPDDLLVRLPALPHEQFYGPRWSPDGNRIAVAQHLVEGRSLRIYDVAADRHSLTLFKELSGDLEELRDPSWSEDGQHLVCAWDVSGISNIYRFAIDGDAREQLTSVLGGAYYPDLRGGRLCYAEFCENGFRICHLDQPQPVRAPRNTLDADPAGAMAYSSRLPKPAYALTSAHREARPYRPTFERLYWFPRVAFDYGTFKPGTYILINDVLEKLNFIGGFAINQKRDYDLFGSVEYREFYPTIFVDYYNIQRRLTSHFADSSRIIGETPESDPTYDQYRIRYRYQLNEVDGGLKLPIGPGRSVKLMGVYDRYVANNRFDDETSISITYFKGWSGKLGYYTDQRRRGIVSSISPSGGYKGYLELTRANQQFFTDLEIGGNAIGLQEIYAPYNYTMAEGGYEKYFGLPGWSHTGEVRLRGGYIGRPVDPFFFMYAGGLPGMRGYSFYSLGGSRTAVGTLTYRFPLTTRAGINLWPLSLNRVYGTLFADVGDAWTGDFESADLKKDIGAGLRMQLHSFYSYPTAISIDVAYGLDKFAVVEDEARTEYGKELRYYLTVLFDFYSPFTDHVPGDH
ncbi:PD40 domain-containing protein [candidate division KSB1 bacterium]|nr:PD40 domain-containing protein [candidate division KSB1 bacterium]